MLFRVTVWSDTLRLPQSPRLSTISIPSRYFYLSSLDHFIWINKAISFLSNICNADPRPTARGGVHAKKRLRCVHMWNQPILQVWNWIWLNYSPDNLFFRLNNNGFAQVIPFKVPRKSELFQVSFDNDSGNDLGSLRISSKYIWFQCNSRKTFIQTHKQTSLQSQQQNGRFLYYALKAEVVILANSGILYFLGNGCQSKIEKYPQPQNWKSTPRWDGKNAEPVMMSMADGGGSAAGQQVNFWF